MSSDFSSYARLGTERFSRFGSELGSALLYPFQSVGGTLLATGFAVVTFIVLILFAQSMAFLNMIIEMPELLTFATLKGFFMINLDKLGTMSIVMNVLYAVLTGIALTNMIAQLRMLQVGSLANIGGMLPGLFAAGCASCGPGLFALFGFTSASAVSFLPFQQTVLRVVGIGMFLLFLGLAGDPRECRID